MTNINVEEYKDTDEFLEKLECKDLDKLLEKINEEKSCWICHGSENLIDNPLIYPCNCYVHNNCIIKHMKSSYQDYCSNCKKKYQMETSYYKSWYKHLDEKYTNTICFIVILIILLYMFVKLFEKFVLTFSEIIINHNDKFYTFVIIVATFSSISFACSSFILSIYLILKKIDQNNKFSFIYWVQNENQVNENPICNIKFLSPIFNRIYCLHNAFNKWLYYIKSYYIFIVNILY